MRVAGKGGKKGKFTEAVCGLDLTSLDIEALALKDPEQLLNSPALAIPLDDLPGLRSGVDDVRRQQPPMQRRLWARTRATFAHIDDVDSHAVGQRCAPLAQPVRAHQLDLAEAQLHLRATRRAAWLSGHFQLKTVGDRQSVAGGKQRIAASHRSVLRGAHEQVQVGRTRPRPALVNVGFTVADHSDQFGSSQYCFGGGDPVLPALRLLGHHRSLAAFRRDLATTHPQLRPGQPEAVPAIRRDRQQRVQKQPLVNAIANRAQPPRAPRMALEIQLCGVLDRQDVATALGQLTNPLAGTLVQRRQAHPIIAQKPTKPDLLLATAAQLPHACGRTLNHALDKQRPLFPVGHPRTGQRQTGPCRSPLQHVAVDSQRDTQCRSGTSPNPRVSQNAAPLLKDVCTAEPIEGEGSPCQRGSHLPRKIV